MINEKAVAGKAGVANFELPSKTEKSLCFSTIELAINAIGLYMQETNKIPKKAAIIAVKTIYRDQ